MQLSRLFEGARAAMLWWRDVARTQGTHRTGRPGRATVMMLADVRGWAWDIKAREVARHLSDELEVDILYRSDHPWNRSGLPRPLGAYDLCLTFECIDVRLLRGVRGSRVLTGVTAHGYTRFKDHRRLLGRARAVHANSRLLLDEVSRVNPNAYYLPNGVNEALFPFVPRDVGQPFAVGYVGKRIPAKGFNEIIVPACQKAGVLLRTATSRHDEAGRIPFDEMSWFYAGVDAVVIASTMDGTPNQLLEAAATGRTFVGNRIGNVPEFVDSANGFLVDREVDAYAERLTWLQSHREECRRMGEAARRTVEAKWTWRHQSQNYRRMFLEIIGIDDTGRNGAEARCR